MVTRSRIQAHSSNGGAPPHVTKVLRRTHRFGFLALIWIAVCALPLAHASGDNAADKPAEKLYLELGQVGLDPTRVFTVRDAALSRSEVHISLEDGTIAFTQDVMGHVTGAFFEGEGEVLLLPPNEVERKSMSLFTGMAILEEHFATAYFRFNDDAANELRPDLRVTGNAQQFVEHWNTTARNLAQADAMRLLISFSRMLPFENAGAPEGADLTKGGSDRFLHARLQGTSLGIFDIYFDSAASEQVQIGQAKTADNGVTYYDVWASFTEGVPAKSDSKSDPAKSGDEKRSEDAVAISSYKIATEVEPPKEIHSRALLQVELREAGTRTLLFELSRFLQVESVKLSGQPVEFIHNPAVEGTQLARRGNDVVAVILPAPASVGQKFTLEFTYGGEVLAEAGSGLLYVGERGIWYPNRGLAMADFDLTFDYPPEWTLVATGKSVPVANGVATEYGEKTARWVSERPIPVAGFNLGKYKVATAQSGNVGVEAYATQGVERDFPGSHTATIETDLPSRRPPPPLPPATIIPTRPSPARNEVTVAELAARAIDYYAQRFGPYPYSHLSLTQMPGPNSQGWPELIFLSSYAFLDEREREQLHFNPLQTLMDQTIPAHETAHQWWGDLINWSSYRDQWFSEGLANYCALMILQEKNPAGFRQIMNKYRSDLVETNKNGIAPRDAGPVTLGGRLLSSRLPAGYEAISYGRGTWLFHMLRTMLRDVAAQEDVRNGRGLSGPDEPFVRALHKLRERYQGRSISTRELLSVFAEDLPPALRYEGKKSLDWFLDGWINGTALPKLDLKAVKFTPKGSGAVVNGTILQQDAPDDLVTSVPVYAVIAGKQPVLLGRVFADGAESSFQLSAPASVRKIVLDPYETILTAPK
jgi:hypothetical protein